MLLKGHDAFIQGCLFCPDGEIGKQFLLHVTHLKAISAAVKGVALANLTVGSCVIKIIQDEGWII